MEVTVSRLLHPAWLHLIRRGCYFWVILRCIPSIYSFVPGFGCKTVPEGTWPYRPWIVIDDLISIKVPGQPRIANLLCS